MSALTCSEALNGVGCQELLAPLAVNDGDLPQGSHVLIRVARHLAVALFESDRGITTVLIPDA